MEKIKHHILVVDDDNRIRELVKEYLSENGFIVSTGNSAEEAKTRIRYFKFDLIVLDVMMPGQDGFEFTKEIKKNSMEFRIKIIEILWKIVYSDGTNDTYESNLIRRVCGLLYVSDRESGKIKQKLEKLIK